MAGPHNKTIVGAAGVSMSRAWCVSAAGKVTGVMTGMTKRIARRYGGVGALIVALAATGCTSTLRMPGAVADLRAATIAIESIEGAPPNIVHSFTRDLNEEAAAHRVAFVPQGTQAQYRARGYLAPQAGAVAWAWDIYDAGQTRVFRLLGEEKAGARGWPDAQVLRRIARASVAQFGDFLAASRTPGPPPPGPATSPGPDPSVVAQRDDFGPEAAGIYRVSTGGPASEDPTAAAIQGVPLPLPRPAAPAALAYRLPAR